MRLTLELIADLGYWIFSILLCEKLAVIVSAEVTFPKGKIGFDRQNQMIPPWFTYSTAGDSSFPFIVKLLFSLAYYIQ